MKDHAISELRICGLALLLLVFLSETPRLSATDHGTPLINHFVGDWTGTGKLMGADAEFEMKWEWVLEGRFVRLTFRNQFQDTGGVERTLKAQAFYRPEQSGKLTGTWFDSRGMVLPLQAKIENDTLTTNWGTPETEQGRTVYRLINHDRIEVEDFVLKNGKWRQFGHAIYRRQQNN